MGKPVFEVEISNNDPKGYETATVLAMPATQSEFHDALQKARITDDRTCHNELTSIAYDGLTRSMIGGNVSLLELNLLALRLEMLNQDERMRFDGLLRIEEQHHDGPIPLSRLINLTFNTDCCLMAPGITNHQELGGILYEGEGLSDAAMALVDTTIEGSDFHRELLELLGRQHQRENDGVFTACGYVEFSGELQEVYRRGEMAYFMNSGAPVALEVRKGFFADSQYDNDKTAVLDLPAISGGIQRAMETVDAASVEECTFRCTDCLIPSLRDAINDVLEDGGLEQVDAFAGKLARLERVWGEAEFVRYKALLAAVGQPDLDTAARLMDEADQYELRSDVAQTCGYAEMVLREKYPDVPEELFQTPQAARIGQKMLDDRLGTITDYGLVRRLDGQPLPDFRQEQGETQRMEMGM